MDSRSKRHQNTQNVIDELTQTDGLEVRDNGRNTIARVDQYGLTEKQSTYAHGVANGLTLRDAYERAYDCQSASTATIYSSASRLMDDPKIAARVKQLMEERQNKTHAIDAMRIRQHVFDRLMIESVDDENPAKDRLKALEMLGKTDVVNMFKESKHAGEDARDDVVGLQEKLKQMLEKMIDITPR